MAHALSPAASSAILTSHPSLNFKHGQTEYRLERQGDQVIYKVQRGAEQLAVVVQWAFGVGNTGQTYVYLKDGALYEARVSFFRSKDGLDITNGHAHLPDDTIEEASGRQISEDETVRCFGCHMSPAGNEFLPGVQCTACHAEAEQHALSFESGHKAQLPAHLHSMTSLEVADFCGRCHRSYDSVMAAGIKTVDNVRFQPYRLVTSRCFKANDERISCVACHNPHEELRKDPAFYDAKCQACHGQPTHLQKTGVRFKACPVGKRDCVSCHMPKIELPEMHNSFTDHRIRVTHKGEAYPG